MLSPQRSLGREFMRYAVPSVVAQWVFALYTMVDGMFVARCVNDTALAAVNLSLPFVNLFFAISLVFAVGTSTIISVRLGRGDAEGANRAYSQNLAAVAALCVLLVLAVLPNLDRVARFLGSTPDTHEYVKTYIGTFTCFSPAFVLAYYFEILIKADGRPKLATLLVTMGTVLNCLLDYLMMVVLPWGVFGAAFATGLSQLGVLIGFSVYFFLSGKAKLRLTRFRFSPGLVGRAFRLGLPSGITDFSAGLMIFLFNHAILTWINEEAIVSYTIVAYVNTIVVMSLTGVAQGMQPLTSYYYGHGDTAICDKLRKYALVAGTVLAAAILVPTWLGAEQIVAIFVPADKAALRVYSVEVFRIFSLSFLVIGFNVILSGWFTAIEREKPAIVISIARGFAVLAICLFGLAAAFGGQGIWWAPLASELICAAISALLYVQFRRSGWQKNRAGI